MDRPIIFNSEMVLATLDGRKTQTRRVIKPQPNYQKRFGQPESEVNADIAKRKCPYGKVGDLLYVKEAWWAVEVTDIGIQYCVFDNEFIKGVPHPKKLRLLDRQDWKWGRHPNIHLPKKHTRNRLKVTGIKVERVQDISEEDAKAEGVEPQEIKHLREIAETIPDSSYCPHKLTFSELWDSINEKRGYGWDVNPFVWVIEFNKLKGISNADDRQGDSVKV